MQQNPRGAVWHMWDLHVHTPASTFHRYPGSKDEQWDAFLADLEALPAEFKAIGINDYLFVEGYERVLKERAAGRLGNLELILPVIEFRLDKFAGSGGKWSKVNCHVIFSDELTPEAIRTQFLSGLLRHYTLTPGCGAEGKWKAVPTRESLIELGEMIRDSTPADKQAGLPSPLHLGAANLCFGLDHVRTVLGVTPLEERFLVAVGKTEWAALPWTAQDIAEKKNTLNQADCVFTAAPSPIESNRSARTLKEQGVKHLLLDCSDAHSLSSEAAEKDRVGNCHTWIKADLTFGGLKQALAEYDSRVFLGDTPPKSALVAEEGWRFLDRLSVRKRPGSPLTERWFDFDLPLGADLVAIIGRKGSGKSALADILGLLTNSPRQADFSFLTPTRFRHPRGGRRDREFTARLTFADGSHVELGLDAEHDPTAQLRANYLPQSLFETICVEIAQGTTARFQTEIEDVIYSRLGKDLKGSAGSLREIIDASTTEKVRATDLKRARLAEVSARIIALERQQLPSHLATIENELQAVKEKIADLSAQKPKEVPKPKEEDETSKESLERVQVLTGEIEELKREIAELEEKRGKNTRGQRALKRVEEAILNLETEHRDTGSRLTEQLSLLGLDWSALVNVTVDRSALTTVETDLRTDREEIDPKLAEEGDDSLRLQLETKTAEQNSIVEQLGAPQREHEAYKVALKEWQRRMDELVGTEELPGTLLYCQKLLTDAATVDSRLADADAEREAICREIYGDFKEIVALLEALYAPVQEFIDQNKDLQAELRLEFTVSLSDTGLAERVLSTIKRNVKGSFQGEDGMRLLNDRLASVDLDSEESVLALLRDLTDLLRYDRRNEGTERVSVDGLMRASHSSDELYEYIFGMRFLQPEFALRMLGKGIQALSPGERGTLLLLFYLLIDDRGYPVILDQPDENLDNETVFKLLVPCVRMAKRTRQIIIVTHNPNIAVVCDAEQVIHATMEKGEDPSIEYASGAIENAEINEALLNVLEGTRPAFSDRDRKYFA